jgi:site-specific recombinase XerD
MRVEVDHVAVESKSATALPHSAFGAGFPLRPVAAGDRLRHSFASLMVQATSTRRCSRKLMGHTTFAVTMELYTHLHEEHKREAMDGSQHLFHKKRNLG